MRIALDAMGGDHAPGSVVLGAVQAVQKDADMHVVLVGDQAQIEPHLPIRILGTEVSWRLGDEISRQRRASIERFLGANSKV